MNKINKKIIIIFASIIVVIGVAAAVLFIPFTPDTDTPVMTIACFSDPHHEYGIQDTESHIRASSENAVEYVKELTDGGADLVFLGGDVTGRNGEWNDETIKETLDASYNVFKNAAKEGKVMVVTGNHDPEPTVHSGTTTINSNDYSEYMRSTLGNYKSAYYTSDLENEFAGPFEELLCYRYEMNGLVFLGLNTPYGDRREVKQVGHNGLYYEQVEWLQKELESISKDKTVFVLCHYPIEKLNTVESATLRVDNREDNASRELMKELMSEYDNVIYCYGHVHTATEQALFKTDELIEPYSDGGAVLCHMGSLGYYNDHFGGPLAFEDPTVVQVTMIYIYQDHIEFSVKNTGKSESYGGEYELDTYTLDCDISIKTNLWNKIFG